MKSVLATRGLAIMALASISVLSFAQHIESGDAGSLPGSAQIVSGQSVIQGALSADGDSDMYQITITNAAAFSATVAGFGNPALDDSQLFLFRMDGTGVAHNDDISTTDFMSALPVGNALYSGLAAGNYLLAISGWDDDAKWSGGYIFPTAPGYTGTAGNIVGPNAAAVGQAITGWDGAAFGVSNGGYQIRMTGVSTVPEPATMAVLGLGAAALLRRRRK